jgi:hypothetical protein
VGSSFEEFIETNLMVQSEFNLTFWFVSYNIFLLVVAAGLASVLSSLSRAFSTGAWVPPQGSFRPSATSSSSGIFGVGRPIEYPLAFPAAAVFLAYLALYHVYGTHLPYRVRTVLERREYPICDSSNKSLNISQT